MSIYVDKNNVNKFISDIDYNIEYLKKEFNKQLEIMLAKRNSPIETIEQISKMKQIVNNIKILERNKSVYEAFK